MRKNFICRKLSGNVGHCMSFNGSPSNIIKSLKLCSKELFSLKTSPSYYLFFISSNLGSWAEIQSVAGCISSMAKTSTSRDKPVVLGAVVDLINGKQGAAVTKIESNYILPFKWSADPNRAQNKQVGRWHPVKAKVQLPSFEWDMHNFETISRPPTSNSNFYSPILDQISLFAKSPNLLTLSDSKSMRFFSSFKNKFSNDASCITGIIAARTPFLNGKEYTLFFEDEILHDGGLGLVLSNDSYNDESMQSQQLVNKSLSPIGQVSEITKSSGNIVLELLSKTGDSSKASTHLVELITGLEGKANAKDRYLVARITWSKGKSQYLKVLGGNLGNGGIALETDSDFEQGCMIEFFIQKGASYEEESCFAEEGLIFSSIRGGDAINNSDTLPKVLKTALISSEEGIIVSNSATMTNYQANDIPGSRIKVLI